MLLLILLSVVFLFLPDLAEACSQHAVHGTGLGLKSPGDILLTMAVLAMFSLPLGIFAGRIVRRYSALGTGLLAASIAGGVIALGGAQASACHGTEAVAPILEQIYTAQMKYRSLHGTYAPSFDELGVEPAVDQYSYFLPFQMISARDVRPEEGVDLSRLPEGVSPVASRDAFTVVVMAFAAPDRLDLWTMDQSKSFREWSVPALPKPEAVHELQSSEPEGGVLSRFLYEYQETFMVLGFLAGLSLGFAYSFRGSPSLTLENA